MTVVGSPNRLTRSLDAQVDHIVGSPDAPIQLVEYGSYACSFCRAAHERIIELRDEFGEQLVHAFRHRPLPGNDLAWRAAELVERTASPAQFWKAYVSLMTRSAALSEEDLAAVGREFDIPPPDGDAGARAAQRVAADNDSAEASGVRLTPTFFINGRKYDGAWDNVSFSDALLGSLGHWVRAAALRFAGWGPAAGLVLLLATLLAVVLSNTAFGGAVAAFWRTKAGLTAGTAEISLTMLPWVNDGLLTIFFLVVGLEISANSLSVISPAASLPHCRSPLLLAECSRRR